MPGGISADASLGDDGPFDLRSYLASEAGDIFLDGWDDLPEVEERDRHGKFMANGQEVTREALLPDDVLDELIRAQQGEDKAVAGDEFSAEVQGKENPTSKTNASSHPTSPSKSAGHMPPATTIGKALASNKTGPSGSFSLSNANKEDGIRKRRRAEDPSVLDMARKLLDARKSEQSSNLASETSALCRDNHRLIVYLKQLGEKLTKARMENTLLKQLVGENMGHAHAAQAQMLASSQPKPSAKMIQKMQEKNSRLSVAEKVSALSVQRMHSQDGTPVACLRPQGNPTSPLLAPETPSPPSMPIDKLRTLGEVSGSQQQQLIKHLQEQLQAQQCQTRPRTLQHEDVDPQHMVALQAAAGAIQTNAGDPSGALFDLLKLVEKQAKSAHANTATSS